MVIVILLLMSFFCETSTVAKIAKKTEPPAIECRLLSDDVDLGLLRREFEDIKKFTIARQSSSKLWHGVPLQNALGATDARGLQLYTTVTNTHMKPCVPTPYLERVPYIKALLRRIEERFGTKTGLVRIFKLPSENAVPPHQDGPIFDFYKGKVCRLHIPIITTADVRFIINNKAYYLEPGKLYFTNVSLTHSVINDGDADRVHLIIDVHANDALRKFIQSAQEPPYTVSKKR